MEIVDRNMGGDSFANIVNKTKSEKKTVLRVCVIKELLECLLLVDGSVLGHLKAIL